MNREEKMDYRIKPEPRKVWVVEFTNGCISASATPNYEAIALTVKKIHGPFELKD